MRAAVVLALVLGLAGPPVVWTSGPEGSTQAGAPSLASPASSACALLRGSAKAEKTCAGDWLATVDRLPLHAAIDDAIDRVPLARHASRLDLHNPPLAPRPPPLV